MKITAAPSPRGTNNERLIYGVDVPLRTWIIRAEDPFWRVSLRRQRSRSKLAAARKCRRGWHEV
jgi:hypothetical protein